MSKIACLPELIWTIVKTDDIAVLLDRRTARKLALAVLDHLTAWAAATYYTRIQQNTWHPDTDGQRLVDPDTGEIYD